MHFVRKLYHIDIIYMTRANVNQRQKCAPVALDAMQLDCATRICDILMCKICCQILNFGVEFFTVGGQENYFLVSICRNRTCKTFENRSTDNVFMAKMNFE